MNFCARELLRELSDQNRHRSLRAVDPLSSTTVQIDGRVIHLFSSNDYLGLSGSSEVKQALVNSAHDVGMGPRGASLICGYTEAHASLEEELARLKGTESALLFPTGFQANLGLLTALGSPETSFFSDALNHASIIDGCRLAKGDVRVYAHRDMTSLETLLKQSKSPRKVVVTDALFSMDGTLAPLPDLVTLCERYSAVLVLDEAHSTLVFGANGGGVAEHFGLTDRVHFHVGTLSKAIGAHGGFVATSKVRREWLLNTARSYVFTTALPMPLVAAARAGLRAATAQRRACLWKNIATMADLLGKPIESPIVPIHVGEESRAMALAASMFDVGFHVGAIRPPTVPRGTSRLRITLSADHRLEVMEALVSALRHQSLPTRSG